MTSAQWAGRMCPQLRTMGSRPVASLPLFSWSACSPTGLSAGSGSIRSDHKIRDMPMPVTDDQVAALRALLADDQDLYKELYARLDRDRDSSGYVAIVNGAFARAVQRRFGKPHQP